MDGDVHTGNILGDCVIYVYDEELKLEAYQLVNAMGAFSTEEDVVPYFTTHVIAGKITPALSTYINNIPQAAPLAKTDKKQTKNLGSQLNVHIVTIDWLKQCFRSQKVVDTE